MFEKIKIIREAATKLYPYFVPSYNNCARTAGFFSAIILVPLASVYVPTLFLNKNDNSENQSNNMDLLTALASVSAVALLNGVQQALSTMLTTSTMQVMKEHNIRLLMDKSKFLMHGNNKEITSLQYVTVGVGVRDFATNAIPIFALLPMSTISSASILFNIGDYTGSFSTSGIVLSFVAASGITTYLLGKKFYTYNTNNQNIENNLVARVGFIEAHRDAISLMEASDGECDSIMQSLQKVNVTIPKLSLLTCSNTLLVNAATAIASQFLGGYYTDGSIKDLSDPNVKVLNVMIMSLLTNVQNIALILTNNYSYIKLNLEQLRAFDKAYSDCSLTRNAHNKMKQEFDGDRLSLVDFSVYRPDLDDNQNTTFITLFNNISLELSPNKIYKLSAESGAGKTTFLKAITNNWQYTAGIVKFPTNAEGNICFIPQHSFISPGTLLEILIYPLKPKKFLETNFRSGVIEEKDLYITINSDDESSSMPTFLDRVQQLLREAKLLPGVIRSDELESENINWNERLSGGEKQKLGIIRAILTDPTFIIMDEATSALDSRNKQIVYDMIKNHIIKSENYTIIYTDHDTTEHFADAILTIAGQSLEYHDLG